MMSEEAGIRAAGISGPQQTPGLAIAAPPAVPGALGSPLAMQQAGAAGCGYACRRSANRLDEVSSNQRLMNNLSF